jgi:hypothetical protein
MSSYGLTSNLNLLHFGKLSKPLQSIYLVNFNHNGGEYEFGLNTRRGSDLKVNGRGR